MTSGVPTHTFVEPTVFREMRVSVRSPGRGVVVEGPSGIGKSTAVIRALEAEGLRGQVQTFQARDRADAEIIALLPELEDFGTAVIEDFHVLDAATQKQIADLLKILADKGSDKSKLILVGINRAGESLIRAAPDLANRIDTIKFGVEADIAKLERLIALGEEALNLRIEAKTDVVREARGSFYLTQMLCFELCLDADILDRVDEHRVLATSLATVKRKVMARQDTRFGESMRTFARGTRFRPGGRAAYLHVLQWLAESQQWDVSLADEMAKHAQQRASVNQIVEKGYLRDLILANPEIAAVLHYDEDLKSLSVEDPHLVFYLRNLDWDDFARRAGFTRTDQEKEYDFALSFAGEDREFAERLKDALEDLDCAVFYDKNEEDRILAEDVEAFLAPIYRSESSFVIAILGPKYGEKRWTRFESDQFKERFGENKVIPVWSTKAPLSAFDMTAGIGGRHFDPDKDLAAQAREIAAVAEKKLRG